MLRDSLAWVLVDLAKGATVALMRPIASDLQQMRKPDREPVRGDPGAALSPVEQRALRLRAPLSTAQFKAVAKLLERGDLPLRRVLRRRRAAP